MPNRFFRQVMRFSVTSFVCFVVVPATAARALTIFDIERGRYDSEGRDGAFEEGHGGNYATGNAHNREFRSFFVFSLPSSTEPVTSASLRAWNPDFGTVFPSGVDSVPLQLYDVTTPIDLLIDRDGGVAAFEDLGTGTLFGSTDVGRDDIGKFIEVPLNAKGVAAINSAEGEWAVGGRLLSPLPRDIYVAVFGTTGDETPPAELVLNFSVVVQPGDANQDLSFDSLDIVQVLIAGKYLTGQAATWGEGDWNGAPGGSPGDPPPGDGRFDQLDIVAALQGGFYLTGPYGAVDLVGQPSDAQTSIGYDGGTGEVWVDAPNGVELTSINVDSASGIFTGDAAQNLGGSFDNDTNSNIFKATFGGSFGSLSFGKVAQPGLSEELVGSDLTVVGSLAGGGDLGAVDLVYVAVPELASLGLLAVGLAAVIGFGRLPHHARGDDQ